MFFNKIDIKNFKNYQSAELELSKGLNCFVGNNGVGKTNLLDAIYYLSFCKSNFNTVDSQLINNGADFFSIKATLHSLNAVDEIKEDTIHCAFKQSQKKVFKFNKKEYKKLSEHIGKISAVIISPYDRDLINNGSEVRRKFFDSVISQFDSIFLNNLIKYNKVLQQRNSLLKRFKKADTFSEKNLSIWDEQLILYGEQIHKRRKDFIEDFEPCFQKHFKYISDIDESPKLRYLSKLNDNNLRDLLLESRNKDRVLQYTTTGIHKDDIEFNINNFPLKKFGSQGQQKSYTIAIKLAQFEYIYKIKKQKPILLLDDIFDKLDAQRVQKIIHLVSNSTFGQVFITDTQEDRIKELIQETSKNFRLFNIKKNEQPIIINSTDERP